MLLENIFTLLSEIKKGIHVDVVTVEPYENSIGEGLKFQFIWFNTRMLKYNFIIPREMFTNDEPFLKDYIIHRVNEEIRKKGESQ